MGYRHILAESDSRVLVDFLAKRSHWPWMYRHELELILDLFAQLHVSLNHIYREANAAADFLARMASSKLQSFVFSPSTLPKQLIGIVNLDRQGFPYLRHN